MTTLKIKRLNKHLILPARATQGSVGYDVYVSEDTYLRTGEVTLVPLGIAIEIEEGYEAQLRLRSSIGLKGVWMPNGVGTIDADYRGEIKMPIYKPDPSKYNPKNNAIFLERGMKIGQLVIAKVELPEVIEAVTLSETIRSGGGFGSTGKR